MALDDLLHSDLILIQGSSMAEAHPVGFRFVVEARERGATVIHVDPRYSRTSALADVWAPIRAGSDLIFLGALIRHVIESGRFFREYVVHYTNAAQLVRPDYVDSEDGAGLFSGFDPVARRYDRTSWRLDPGAVDPTLEDPRTVFQVLRRHFARYTPELVAESCGIGRTMFERIAELFLANSGPERTGAICYAVGWTQHTKGVQVIRAAAILQLLLGNIGRPGGGIMALRGHASIQGSTDIPTLYHLLPGYMPMPRPEDRTLADYLARNGTESGQWAHLDAYLVSYLKATYGSAATPENDFGFDFLPRIVRDHGHLTFFSEMADGLVEGLFVLGQNPGVAGQHAAFERRALGRLKWLVVRDMVETETANFWRDSPEVQSGELRPEAIDTEVFLFPAAGHAEKAGTFTNTQRLLQCREKALDPPGDARSDFWFVVQLGARLKARAQGSRDEADRALAALAWDYPTDPQGEPDQMAVLYEMNGRDLRTGELVPGYSALRADGGTSSGAWIYSGVTPREGLNLAAGRAPAHARGPYGHGWGFAWPADRRILYNRASARPDGRPWSEQKALVWWDAERRQWTGHDVPDGDPTLAPDHQPGAAARGLAALRGNAPFIMKPDGVAWLFTPAGVVDGPLPTHYEPIESPVDNPLYACATNPMTDRFERPENPLAAAMDPRFPIVLTTYRLTEHHTAGGMSRTLSRLSELQPELFCELSPELADELKVADGDWITLVTLRAAIEARALVTPRIRPLAIAGRQVHQVAIPFHWGWTGLVTGDCANDLVPLLGEPNVSIHEGKALLCNVWPGRKPPPPALDEILLRLKRGESVAAPRVER